MLFKAIVLAAFGEEKGLLEGSIRSVAFLGYRVWTWVPYGGLEEVVVLVVSAEPIHHR